MAAAAQQQIADDGDVLPRFYRAAAFWTARGRGADVERFLVFFVQRQFEMLFGCDAPLFLEHDRQAVDNHVEKAAHQQAEQDGEGDVDFGIKIGHRRGVGMFSGSLWQAT